MALRRNVGNRPGVTGRMLSQPDRMSGNPTYRDFRFLAGPYVLSCSIVRSTFFEEFEENA